MSVYFSDAAEEWLQHIKNYVKISTYAQYKLKLEKNILPYFDKVLLTDIDADKIHNFYSALSDDKLSESYISNILSIFKMIMKYLSSSYGFADPTKEIIIKKPDHSRISDTISNEFDFQRLYNVLLDKPDLTKAGILLTLFLGLKTGELCALKWGDIDLENKIIVINKSLQRVSSDGGTDLVLSELSDRSGLRIVPVIRVLADYLEPFKTDDEKFFLSAKNEPIEPRTMQYRLKSLLKKEKLPEISFSELRKVFVSRCINQGADIATLSDILGNVSVQSIISCCPRPTMESKKKTVELVARD